MAFSGTYKSFRFRSLLELSIIRSLEGHWPLGSEMLYEHTRIPYGRDGRRTYVVDLTIPSAKLLIEVKPLKRSGNRNNLAKAKAAREWCRKNGWEYLIITEVDILSSEMLSLEQAAKIDEVKLNPRALKILARKNRQKIRKIKRCKIPPSKDR